MTRPFRQLIDEEILDRAAAMFAQHGFAHTSLQSLADAVGLSKSGLLHHYPSKDALYEAAQAVSRERARRVRDQVVDLPPGQERDLRVLELLVEVALERPGLVALAFRAVTTPGTHTALLEADDLLVFESFAVDQKDGDQERLVRVIGALGALAVLSLAAHEVGDRTTWRPRIVATCFDALGHRRPGHHPDARPDQVEA